MNVSQPFSFRGWLGSGAGIGFLAFLGIAAFVLATSLAAHFFGILPYALLLLCPLLHLFLHGGHADHRSKGDQN